MSEYLVCTFEDCMHPRYRHKWRGNKRYGRRLYCSDCDCGWSEEVIRHDWSAQYKVRPFEPVENVVFSELVS